MFNLKTVLLIFFPIYGIAEETTDAVTTDLYRLSIITRAEWDAQGMNEAPEKLSESPAPYVIIRDTDSIKCFPQYDCDKEMRRLQNVDMIYRKNTDIRYNFCVDESGDVFEGRGWDNAGAHTGSYNNRSIGICLIGKYQRYAPDETALEAIRKLIAKGVSLGKISLSYQLYTYSQLAGSYYSKPGKLTDIIKTWPHAGNDTTKVQRT